MLDIFRCYPNTFLDGRRERGLSRVARCSEGVNTVPIRQISNTIALPEKTGFRRNISPWSNPWTNHSDSCGMDICFSPKIQSCAADSKCTETLISVYQSVVGCCGCLERCLFWKTMRMVHSESVSKRSRYDVACRLVLPFPTRA